MLDEAQSRGQLHFCEPLLPGSAHRRALYVADQLFKEISDAKRDQYRMGALERDFDRFCTDPKVIVGRSGDTDCFMKRLEPAAEEVWEIRSRDPSPQVRVFGRFASPDVFVATHARYRKELGRPSESKWSGNAWPDEIKRCKHIWKSIFLTFPPHSGAAIDAYITEGAVDLGDLP